MSAYDTATNAVDVVGVYDKDFRQLVPEARSMKAIISRTSKTMDHPLENGATITDHRIIEPVNIELALVLNDENFRSTYRNIFTLFHSAQLLTIQTKTDTFANMLIESMPHDETPEMQTAVAMVLKLKEVILVKTQFQALPPAATGSTSRNQSTVKRGEQTPRAETTDTNGKKKSSVLYDILYGD